MAAALDLDPTMRDRHDDAARAALLSDLEAFVDRLITAIASGDPRAMATFADLVAVRYRKRKVAMDDVITLCEGLRRAAAAAVEPSAEPAVDAALDAAIVVFKWHRRLAGDARKRNAFLALSTRAPELTIKWVSRPAGHERRAVLLRHPPHRPQLLELRRAGYTLGRMLNDHPELRRMGVAAAYEYASRNRDRYADFFEKDGSIRGPGYSAAEADGLPSQYRIPGVVIESSDRGPA